MSWQVMQYLEENPGVPPLKAVVHFAEEMQIEQQIRYLIEEVDKVLSIRQQLRPLYGKKSEIENRLVILNSQIEMKIAIELPPGKKGNPAKRKAKKLELQESNEHYQETMKELEDLKNEIELVELELYETQSRAKNARKIVDTFNTYADTIHQYAENKDSVSKYVDNADAF